MNSELTRDELDALAKMYLDCRLSRLEERELELLLAETGESSEAIDEARLLMGLCTAMAAVMPRRKARRPWERLAGVAASVAVVCAVATTFLTQGDNAPHTACAAAETITVYVDGEYVSDPVRAYTIAEETMHNSMLALTAAQCEMCTAVQQTNMSFNQPSTQYIEL